MHKSLLCGERHFDLLKIKDSKIFDENRYVVSPIPRDCKPTITVQ